MTLKKGIAKVLPESLDDLWHLYNIKAFGYSLMAISEIHGTLQVVMKNSPLDPDNDFEDAFDRLTSNILDETKTVIDIVDNMEQRVFSMAERKAPTGEVVETDTR